MQFRIQGLDAAPFQPLFALTDVALAEQGVHRCIADVSPGYPDRIELRDAEPGESLLLLNYTHQPANTPYRASHAIFVLESATQRFDREGEIPPALRRRLLSLRAFDGEHLLVDAEVVHGREVEPVIERLLENPRVQYLHAHYAKPGCYAARIDRA